MSHPFPLLSSTEGMSGLQFSTLGSWDAKKSATLLKPAELTDILHKHLATVSNVTVPFKGKVDLDIIREIHGEKLRIYKAKY